MSFLHGSGESSLWPKESVPVEMASSTVAGRKWKRPTGRARGESAFWDPVNFNYFGTLSFIFLALTVSLVVNSFLI